MSDIGNLILNTSLSIVTLWIVNKFLNFYLVKKQSNILIKCLWFFFGLFQYIIEYNKGTGSIWKMIISIIVVLIISVFGFEKAGKIKLLNTILLHVTWVLIEMLTFLSIKFIPISESIIIGSVISKIFIILIVNILTLSLGKIRNHNVSLSYYIIFLSIAIGSIYIAVNEFYSNKLNNKINSMFTFSVLLLINIIIFEIYSKLGEYLILEKEKTAYTQQINIMSKNTEEQKKIMEEFYQDKHNLTNQLIVLKGNINNNQESVIEELNKIINSCEVNANCFSTGNNVVDALINNKFATAKVKEINFHLNIFIPEVIPVNQCDLGIVLGNALDNAIEATENCKNHDKKICISMGIKKEALIIIIKNPYEHTLKEDRGGSFISTKEEGRKHGFGVNSINKVADKYDGAVIIETEDNQFKLIVIINIKDFSQQTA